MRVTSNDADYARVKSLKLKLRDLRESVAEAERSQGAHSVRWEPAGHAFREFERDLKERHPELF